MPRGPVVFFDLETTGLPRNNSPIPDIIQIGAVDSWRKYSFDMYLQPTMPIEKGATNVHKLTANRKKTRLFLNGEEVIDPSSQEEGLQAFVDWLRATFDEPVVLVAHSCFRLFGKILLRNFEGYNIDDYESVISGFSDCWKASLDVFDEGPRNLEQLLQRVGLNKKLSHDAFYDAHDTRTLVKRMAKMNDSGFQRFVRDERWFMSLADMQDKYGIQRNQPDSYDDSDSDGYGCYYDSDY